MVATAHHRCRTGDRLCFSVQRFPTRLLGFSACLQDLSESLRLFLKPQFFLVGLLRAFFRFFLRWGVVKRDIILLCVYAPFIEPSLIVLQQSGRGNPKPEVSHLFLFIRFTTNESALNRYFFLQHQLRKHRQCHLRSRLYTVVY